MRSVLMSAAFSAVILSAAVGGTNAAGDLSRQEPIEVTVELGRPGQHVFVPKQLKFETGKLYKLILRTRATTRTTSPRTASRSSSSPARCR